MKSDKYLISKDDLLAFLRYEILYKWKEAAKLNPENEDFGFYLLKETPYQPDSDFIQSLCETKEEHENPIETGIYNDILPADVARYQAATLYKPYKES